MLPYHRRNVSQFPPSPIPSPRRIHRNSTNAQPVCAGLVKGPSNPFSPAPAPGARPTRSAKSRLDLAFNRGRFPAAPRSSTFGAAAARRKKRGRRHILHRIGAEVLYRLEPTEIERTAGEKDERKKGAARPALSALSLGNCKFRARNYRRS